MYIMMLSTAANPAWHFERHRADKGASVIKNVVVMIDNDRATGEIELVQGAAAVAHNLET